MTSTPSTHCVTPVTWCVLGETDHHCTNVTISTTNQGTTVNTNPDPFAEDDDLVASLANAAQALPTPEPLRFSTGIDPDMIIRSKAIEATPDDEARVAEMLPTMTRPFRPHQVAAFLYLYHWLSTKGRGFAGHDMGLGKSQVALALLSMWLRKPGDYAIIIAPPVAWGGFLTDLQASFPHLKMVHLMGRTVHARPEADIYFINADPLTLRAWLCSGEDERGKLIPSTFTLGASFLVRDEIHGDKAGDAGGSKPSLRGRVMLAAADALRTQGTPILGHDRHLADQPASRGLRTAANRWWPAIRPRRHSRCLLDEVVPVALLRGDDQEGADQGWTDEGRHRLPRLRHRPHA